MKNKVNICWLRRDLRLEDNAALYHALKEELPTVPVFIFDKNILDKLEDKHDRRITFIYGVIEALQQQLTRMGTTLHVFYGEPVKVFKELMTLYSVASVFTNVDYEPYAKDRDMEVSTFSKANGIPFLAFKDQVIFEKDEVLKENGEPYTIFTPYSRKWKAILTPFYLRAYPSGKLFENLLKHPPISIPSLKSMGFYKTADVFPGTEIQEQLIKNYSTHRNFPSEKATSRLSVHLRFGTISIRQVAAFAKELSDVFLSELIWRDFYQAILWHFPHVAFRAFKPAYDHIQWRNNEDDFQRWCNGTTGYPIVDAGMRELNNTGFMHNRVRMIVASFLTKHLLIDWRWGEAYFAAKLIDYDLAANNGGWQWAAGSGCDAAPYFRIFNPYTQTKKFDKDLFYIKKWVPEFEEFTYPAPIVDHEYARKRCLEVYAKSLKVAG